MLLICTMALTSIPTLQPEAVPRSVHSEVLQGPKQSDEKPKGDEKPFAELIKGKVPIEGFITLYRDTVDQSVLLAIKPDQFDTTFLMGVSRTSSDGSFNDPGAMLGTTPVYFKRVGKTILLLERNTRFRLSDTSAVGRKLLRGAASDGLITSVAVKSQPDPKTKAVLIDASSLFITDIYNASFFSNQPGGPGMNFDARNSTFQSIKSFPLNTEITVRLHYKTNRPQGEEAWQNPYSYFLNTHFSLYGLRKSDYVPRYADDRVGNFMTVVQDYSDVNLKTPYVRFSERWNLKKKDTLLPLSEPVTPIVYWVDKNVPLEYRDAFAEGIEFYNRSFEKIGFRNAIVAKQMPDTADWDPADARFNVVQWIVVPGAAYAVGPNRTNPFTGEVYDADIRVSADFIRFMLNTQRNYIQPHVSSSPTDALSTTSDWVAGTGHDHLCSYQESSHDNLTFSLLVLGAVNDPIVRDSLIKEYVHAYTVELVAHEVGHTLGFRHNFKGTSIYSLEQVQDRSFTKVNSLTGSIMDYGGPNLAAPGKPQGEFYASVPGPYDDWVVEYSYSEFGGKTPEEDYPHLQKIAAKSADPRLAYATDEDFFGWTAYRGPDPLVELHQVGQPLEYARRKLELTKHLWKESIKNVEQPGARYVNYRNAFASGWRAYTEAVYVTTKHIGGIYKNRSHPGDAPEVRPFTPVPATKQREALDLLMNELFSSESFNWPADQLNKLQLEQFLDFTWSAGNVATVDYNITGQIFNLQNLALNGLFHPQVLGRLVNNLERVDGDQYTMLEHFSKIRRSLWSELDGGGAISDIRRNAQLQYLNRLANIMTSPAGIYPADARSLAISELMTLKGSVTRALAAGRGDGMTSAHLNQTARQIDAALDAEMEHNR
jgi:hypothetical protein